MKTLAYFNNTSLSGFSKGWLLAKTSNDCVSRGKGVVRAKARMGGAFLPWPKGQGYSERTSCQRTSPQTSESGRS
ncbi:hypothetical protein SAMN04488109_2663 [Chryseolinea serpens]|uniref:Uncharacterized protein n=1 Tax=Chryseolinea serpens TaxID=947013 RepID=A0A1M5P442_9BACT|nr:hypothetical protein SAMN04488109_2663 [Chryseolinea serpens]